MQRITIHQSDLEKLKIKLNDSKYLEYIWHKFLDNPNATWSEDILKKNKNWSYPDCWLTRYYTYYDNCKNFIENKKILDIGSCLNPLLGLEGWKYTRGYLTHYWLNSGSPFGTQVDVWQT